jgi:hypothetical protein
MYIRDNKKGFVVYTALQQLKWHAVEGKAAKGQFAYKQYTPGEHRNNN